MKRPSTLIQPGTVRLERLLPGPIERAWAYITESDKRAKWLAAGEFDLRVGGRIELRFDNDKLSPDAPRGGGAHVSTGVITRLEPPHVLAHTWNSEKWQTEVTYELAQRGDQVQLTILHRNLGKDFVLPVMGGWDVHTGILADVLEGVPPRSFWSTHERLTREYAEENAAATAT